MRVINTETKVNNNKLRIRGIETFIIVRKKNINGGKLKAFLSKSTISNFLCSVLVGTERYGREYIDRQDIV